MTEIFDLYSKYPISRISEIGLDRNTADFLVDVGLPNWCAPNMHFGEEDSWLPEIVTGNNILYVLGSDRDGHHICICDGVTVVRRKGTDTEFMAGNVQLLYQAIHEFQSCIDRAVDSDPSAYTSNNISSSYLDPFVFWLRKHEPRSLDVGSFWLDVLQWLKYKI